MFIRSDVAVLTPAADQWNPDGFPGNYGSLWIASGTPGYRAEYQWDTNAGEYDIYLQIKTGPDLSPGEMFVVNFKPGGTYQLSPDERITNKDASAAASGKVTYTVDTNGDTFPEAAFVYLGRFQCEGGGKASVVHDVGQSSGTGNSHTPVIVSVSEVQASYGPLQYNDYDSVPGGWVHSDATEFAHYWWNATNDPGLFRASQFFPFPAADRTTGPGNYRVEFTHFDIWHPQHAKIPATVYFKPGGKYTKPNVGGSITGVDEANAAAGRVTVEITWPTATGSGPPYPKNTFSLGEYELDSNLYGLKLNSFPTGATGEAVGPKFVSLTYVPPEVLRPPINLRITPGITQVDLAWDPPASGLPVAGYNVYRIKPAPETKLNDAVLTATQLTVTGLPRGTELCFMARSVDSNGQESSNSDPICATLGPTISQKLGKAIQIRHDAATLTPVKDAWNSDDFGGNLGTAWFEAGTPGYMAEYSWPSNANEYDVYLHIKTGITLSTSVPFTVRFRPGGSYQLSPDERVVGTTTSNAAAGEVSFEVDTSAPEFPNPNFVYLGRFECADLGVGSVICDVENASGPAEVHVPIAVWVAEKQPSYGPLAYNDFNSVPAGWVHYDTTEFEHYWWNAMTASPGQNVFRASQFYPFPASDRTDGPGVYLVEFTHFDIWHKQDGQIPLTIYFKSGGKYTPPTVGGFITAVDDFSALDGRVSVEVAWPTATGSGPPYPKNKFSLGEYEMDAKLYGLKLNGFPSPVTGEALGPEVVSLTFIPPQLVRPPENVRVAGGETQADLAWNPPSSGPAAAGYNVYRTKPGPETKLNESLVTVLSFTVSGLPRSEEFCFTIRSVDSDGRESVNSDTVCVTLGPPITKKVGQAFQIRHDVAVLTPDVGTWNPDGFGGDFGSAWMAAGTAGYQAEYRWPSNANEYDVYLQIKTGPTLSAGVPFIVHFKPGGTYQLSPDERITSIDSGAAANGVVTYIVDTSGPQFPNTAFVYLGRYEGADLGVGSVVCDVAHAAGPSDVHIPVSIWVAEKQPLYGPLAYNDYNSVPAGWVFFDTTEFNHYYWNATANTNVFRASQFYPLPAAERIDGAGIYRVDFTHFTIWHAQHGQLPLLIYFKPEGQFTPPATGGFITNVDTSQAAQGRVAVEIKWPTSTSTGPPYPKNTFSLGEYEFDEKLYGLKLNNFTSSITGEAIGPEVVSLAFVRSAGGLQRPGDCNQDNEIDQSDAVCILSHLFLGNPKFLPCGDNQGKEFPGNLALLNWNTDNDVDLTDAINLLQWKFLGGTPHILGQDCVAIGGCPDACR
ncbi:MAG: fibronectin type III domain-containing protein [Planctomycetes bacterium]|nr:fibronectin type III domain-containing protein [Planctomycetota bacterium]